MAETHRHTEMAEDARAPQSLAEKVLRVLSSGAGAKRITHQLLELITQRFEATEASIYFFSRSVEGQLSCAERVIATAGGLIPGSRNSIPPGNAKGILAALLTSGQLTRELAGGKGIELFFPIKQSQDLIGVISIGLDDVGIENLGDLTDTDIFQSAFVIGSEYFEAEAALDFDITSLDTSSSQKLFQKSLLASLRGVFDASDAYILDFQVENSTYEVTASSQKDNYQVLDPYIGEDELSQYFEELKSGNLVELRALSQRFPTDVGAGWFGFLLYPERPVSSLVLLRQLRPRNSSFTRASTQRTAVAFARQLAELNSKASDSSSVRAIAIEERSLRLAIEVARIYKHRSINRAIDLESYLQQLSTSAKNLRRATKSEHLEKLEDRLYNAKQMLAELKSELENITKWRSIKKTAKTVEVSEIWNKVTEDISDRLDRESVKYSIKGTGFIRTYPDYLEHTFLTFVVNSLDAFEKNNIKRKKRRINLACEQTSNNGIQRIRLTYSDTAGGIKLRDVKDAEGNRIDDIREVLEGGVTSNTEPSRGYGLVVVGSYIQDHPDSSIMLKNQGAGLSIEIMLTGFPEQVE